MIGCGVNLETELTYLFVYCLSSFSCIIPPSGVNGSYAPASKGEKILSFSFHALNANEIIAQRMKSLNV